MSKPYKFLVPLVLFCAALFPRLISLGVTATADQEIWIIRSFDFVRNVLAGNWGGTLITTHPGVTTMWLSGPSLYLHNKYLKSMDAVRLFFAAEFPIALVTALSIILMYLFIKKIFNKKIALLASLLIAFDPSYIAHSRCVHLDALLTSFMVLSTLSFLAYLTDSSRKYYIICSGFFAGLALLTKLPAIFLLPFIIVGITVWYLPDFFQRQTQISKSRTFSVIKVLLLWMGVLIVAFVVLWPAMWVQPRQIIGQFFLEVNMTRTVAHGSDFFMGKISDGTYSGIYGLFYYLVHLAMRLTPITLSLSIFCVICFFRQLKKNGFGTINKSTFLLLCYFVFFTVMVSLVAKKGDRYLLPVFPVIDILAALGLWHLVSIISNRPLFRATKYKNAMALFIFICVIGLQAGSSLSLHPYYLSYYNPMIGGTVLAKKILNIGWGEGMDKAARYLNEKPNAKDLTVAVQYTAFRPYFVGKTAWMDYHEQVDYLVFYISAIQRHWHYPLWKKYKDKTPEYVVRINNIDYAWVYKVDK